MLTTKGATALRKSLFNTIATSRRWECIRVPVPEMTESISEGAIQSWNKQAGDFVQADELVAVIDTDKISVDVLSPVKGKLIKTFAGEGDAVIVGDDLFEIDTDASSGSSAPTSNPKKPEKKADFKIGMAGAREERRVPMPRMRQKIGERLKSAQNDCVCLTTFQEVDMTKIMALRKKLQPEISSKYHVKLGFMSFFLAAAARALEATPNINSIADGKEIVERNFIDLSVAVSTPTGLVVPVVRDAHKMSLVQLEKEVANLAAKARENKLSMDDMSGGTFTISNGGVYGSLFGTPVLNPPQSAILGMHGIQQRAVVRDGKIVARPMMYLALTYDHRMVDGKEAVTFLKTLANYVEDPDSLLKVTALV